MCERFEMKERVYHEALLVIQALVAPDTRYPAAFCTRDFIQQCQLCGMSGSVSLSDANRLLRELAQRNDAVWQGCQFDPDCNLSWNYRR
ncbi:hypothetical protein DID95_12115 [Vibrio fluvialis]|nr:hypothetical protein [Vibrio fluvialis]TOY91036.1 hypothetical protein DJ016_22710 [Vibrio fluvialis]TRN07602.1 hypothetical protein DM587_22730 [Vibrio fluvialis]